MIDYKSISNGEGGLSVRAKINSMFRDLVSGNEGVNQLWQRITSITSDLDYESQQREDMYTTLKAQILNAFDYTDKQVTDLKVYVDALESGLGGFIPSTSYNPDVSEDKAYTFIAVGAGTYTHFLDSTGQPITISDDNSLTIFYKGAGSTYWQTKSVTSIVVKEALDGGSASSLNTRIQIRRDTEANWKSSNPVLKQGEIALVSQQASLPYRYTDLKVGDGASTFTELPYLIGNNPTLNGKFTALTLGIGFELVLSPSVVATDASATVTVTARMTQERGTISGTADSMKITSGVSTLAQGSDRNSLSYSYSHTANEKGNVLFSAEAEYMEMQFAAEATLTVRDVIYHGFGDSASAVRVSSNRLDVSRPATGTYPELTCSADGQKYYILVPERGYTLPSQFTMGGAPFVMNRTSQNISNVEYAVYESGSTYNTGATVHVTAS